ncbi:MAG: 3-hydroxyacyl-CoA dehydrogenase NAD-binding domain-containing protein [Deltaproteobacteria bacterium]|nr:3-hydroxyacyl-CoA dehydrogenase NAD-binding domain-containing protein [Deltaproteobacteria bacterium]
MTFPKLLQREKEGRPIKVAVVGAGMMGAGVINQISRMPGIRVCLIADLVIDKARKVFEDNRVPRQSIQALNHPDAIQDAIRQGQSVVTEDAELPAQVDVDAVVEATGSPDAGARVAYCAILGRKHTIMLNVEADVMVGPVLASMARSAGVVYTLASGDQPGAICEMYDWAKTLGLEVVAAGRGTQLGPSARHVTPDAFVDAAKRLGGNAQMLCSFHDGTKSQVEMAAVSNALGLVPDKRGMHEPFACVEDLPGVFRRKELGGVLSRNGVVELANSFRPDGFEVKEGMVNPGVFLVVTSDHPGIQGLLKHLFRRIEKAGPNYGLFRPYHLTAVETPYSVVRACLYGEATGAAGDRLLTEVVAVAKKDLKQGELLDGGGGYTVYGLVERAEVAKKERLLPLGFAYKIPVLRDIPRDAPITQEDVRMDTESFLYKLRALKDS